MEVLQNRTDSFKPKRVQNPSKPSTTVSVKWPHPRRFIASPAVLAEAGFYFNPSYEDRDNVTCFYCEKQLSHWEAEDDPFDIHWEKCRTTCCWAIVRCGLRNDMDNQRRFISADKSRLPTSKNMEQARLGTFQAGNGWIHDRAEDHGASSSQMARAGFVYTPQREDDDLATCLYCEVSLSGWDADDDPMEEHKKRGNKSEQKCAFLATFELAAAGSKPPSRSVSQSKPSSKSTQSKSKFKEMVLPTKIHDGELDDLEDFTPTAASSVKRPARGRSTSGSTRSVSGSTRSTKSITTVGKTAKTHTRSQSRGLKGVNEDTEDGEEEMEVEMPPAKTRRTTTTKTSRSRSKSVPRSVPESFIEDDEEGADIEERKSVKGKSKAAEESCIEGDGEVEEIKILKKSTRSKPKAKPEEDVAEGTTTLKKPTRGRPKVKPASPEEESDEDDEIIKTSRQSSRARPKAKQELEPEEIPEANLKETAKPPSKTTSKPGIPAARKPSRTKPKPAIIEEIERPEDEEPTLTFLENRENAPSTRHGLQRLSRPKSLDHPEEVKTVPSDDGHGESDEMDVFVSLSLSPPQPPSPPPIPNHEQKITEEDLSQSKELSPLVIPKRTIKGKEKALSVNKPEEGGDQKNNRSTASEVKNNHRGKDNASSTATLQEESEEVPGSQRIGKMPLKTPSSRETIPSDRVSTNGMKKQNTGIERKGIAVVEISTDEESGGEVEDDAQHQKSTKNQKIKTPRSKMEEKHKPPEETAQPPRLSIPQSRPPIYTVVIQEPKDVEMTDAEAGSQQSGNHSPPPQNHDQENLPKTPPRKQHPDLSSQSVPSPAPAPALIFPPLSKIPFTPIQSLSEAELDMTVEEWIRYQMEVEYDKFRRDGERELGRFKKRAEEVRGIIEAL